MKRLLGIVLLAVFMLTSHSAYAGFKSGNALVNDMREFYKMGKNDQSINSIMAANYIGYIIGVFDATESEYRSPEDITVGQLCHIVAKFLENNPERWSEPADRLVRQALRKAFPKKLGGTGAK
jgi:hypothetical protein